MFSRGKLVSPVSSFFRMRSFFVDILTSSIPASQAPSGQKIINLLHIYRLRANVFGHVCSSPDLCFPSRLKFIIFCYDIAMWSLISMTFFSYPYAPHSSLRRSASRWHAIRRFRHTLVTLYATSVASQRTLAS